MEWMFLPLRRYAEFTGRSRRKEYWMFVLGYSLVLLVFGVLFGVMGAFSSGVENVGADSMNGTMLVAVAVIGIFVLAIFIPSLAVQVRRLHDRDMSGWWLLLFYVLSAIPVIGFLASIALLVLFVLPGTPGPNRFGPDPKDPFGSVSDTDIFA